MNDAPRPEAVIAIRRALISVSELGPLRATTRKMRTARSMT